MIYRGPQWEDAALGPSLKDNNLLDPHKSQADMHSVHIKVPRQAKLRASDKIKRIGTKEASICSLLFRPSTKDLLVSHFESIPI